MPGVSKIVFKKKDIVLVDYKDCTDEKEMIRIFREAAKLITSFQEEILVLINFEGAYQTPNYMKEAKQIMKETQPFVIKRAIVGLNNPAKLILLNAFNELLGKKKIKPFKTLQEAKEWLVE